MRCDLPRIEYLTIFTRLPQKWHVLGRYHMSLGRRQTEKYLDLTTLSGITRIVEKAQLSYSQSLTH